MGYGHLSRTPSCILCVSHFPSVGRGAGQPRPLAGCGTTRAAGGPPPPSITPRPSPLVVSHFPLVEQYSALALGSRLSTGLPSTFSLLVLPVPYRPSWWLVADGWWLVASRPLTPIPLGLGAVLELQLAFLNHRPSRPLTPIPLGLGAVPELLHLQLAAGGWWLVVGGFPFQPLILNLEQWDPLSPAIPQLYLLLVPLLLLLLLLIIIPVLFLLAPQPPVPPRNRQCGMRTLNLAYFHSAFPSSSRSPLVANFHHFFFLLLVQSHYLYSPGLILILRAQITFRYSDG